MRVILAEKPDMGRKIAEALGEKKKGKGYIELQNGDVVTWAIGHLIRLKTPDAQDEKYKKWSLETLPLTFRPDLEVDPNKQEQFEVIRRLLEKAEACIIATDPGREGELIGRWILEVAKYQGRVLRLWIDDLTPATIQEGFHRLKDGAETFLLGEAAKVRAYADYWVGMTATRFFTLLARDVTKENTLLSAGRVQTPTLRIVYDREQAIENFQPEPFFTLAATFAAPVGTYTGQWFRKTGDETLSRFSRKEEAEAVQKKIKGKPGTVVEYSVKEIKRAAPQLLDSTAIKVAARKMLGFSAAKTDQVLQSLYDQGFCTYPRTASRHLSENAARQLTENLRKLREKSPYRTLFPERIDNLENRRFVDDQKAKEHHAIVPTGLQPANLNADEEKLYELILRHTLAAYHPEGVDREISVITRVENETFQTRAVQTLVPGWRSVLKPDPEEEPVTPVDVPPLQEQQTVTTTGAKISEGKTTPPKRLADSDLIKAMETAGRLVEDEAEDDVLQILKEKGIGTPATRTAIVQELAERQFIEIKKNLVYLTEKGRRFMELVYDHPISSIELTGEFEKKLNDVAEGRYPVEAAAEDFRRLAASILDFKDAFIEKLQARAGSGAPVFQTAETIGNCPLCGKPVLERKEIYSCSGFREGCKVVIPKTFLKQSISPKTAKSLLEGKEVLLQNIPGQYGPYSLFIQLKNGKLETRKPDAEDRSLGACPHCGKPVVEQKTFYGCTGYKEGCRFTLPKEFLGKALSAAQVKKLLKTGKTDVIKGLKGKKGEFDAALGYSVEERKITFVR